MYGRGWKERLRAACALARALPLLLCVALFSRRRVLNGLLRVYYACILTPMARRHRRRHRGLCPDDPAGWPIDHARSGWHAVNVSSLDPDVYGETPRGTPSLTRETRVVRTCCTTMRGLPEGHKTRSLRSDLYVMF